MSSSPVTATPQHEAHGVGQRGDDWLFGLEGKDVIAGGPGNDLEFEEGF
jgi:hypothetical protein